MNRTSISFNETTVPDYGPAVFEKEFPSEPALIPAVIVRLVNFLIDAGFVREETRNQISLCLDEALKNAVLHGNASVPGGTVRVSVQRCPGAFWIVIQDDGEGFDIAAVPDPLDENGLWREGGRGIHLMSHYTKALQFWNGGSTAALCFARASSGTSGEEDGAGEAEETDHDDGN